ncbi:MAG: hypothetical protein DRQ55_08600 [Planctomycetota bacterium]|nr:MAG: hypothetical protein DRQ55_08600 [Planctomycetota bacterium]
MQRVLELEGPGRFSTSTVPGEHSPQAFYERLGFAATGEIEDGEVVLARQLVAAEPRSAPGPDTGAPAPGSDFYCERVLSGDVHVRIVERSGDVLAFHHTRPRWPVHIVVIPTRHVPSLTDLGPSTDGPPEQLLADLLAAVRRVAAQVEREHGAARVITNLGSYQDSKHLHWHICSGKPIGDDGL